MLIENLVLGVETRGRHLCRHRDANGVAHALSERTGRALDAGRFKKFRMTRRLAMELAEIFDVVDRQIVAAHVQPRVEKHAAVSGGENEIIATDPAWLIGIVFQNRSVKYRAHLRAAERQSEMAGLRRLHRIHREPTRFVGCARKNFEIQTHERFKVSDCRLG